ncbi:olfactory receptor 5V1-like [Leptodactylus fuscus]|uniref:olfactory receptor 5V1-like n=1 Tax=Leptodactylus fuscus TaxID=238119 RepID=UPI003F4E838F
MENITLTPDFYFIAFSQIGRPHLVLFAILLPLYIVCIGWNLVIFVVILLDPILHKPMYFFLRSLSFVDILYISVSLPKLFDIIVSGNIKVSFVACFTQMCFFIFLACTEICLLTAMSYDRYVAICFPLHYTILMEKTKCGLLVAGCWISGCCNSVFITVFASDLSFCKSTLINQLFCEIKVLTKISCGDTNRFQIVILIDTFLMGLCPFLLIMLSYAKIILNILGKHSKGQRKKAFSTCSSHLIILVIFYGTLFVIYLRPTSQNSDQLDRIFSVLYLAVTPTLNPLVYSLRNKEIKRAMKNILCRLCLEVNTWLDIIY